MLSFATMQWRSLGPVSRLCLFYQVGDHQNTIIFLLEYEKIGSLGAQILVPDWRWVQFSPSISAAVAMLHAKCSSAFWNFFKSPRFGSVFFKSVSIVRCRPSNPYPTR